MNYDIYKMKWKQQSKSIALNRQMRAANSVGGERNLYIHTNIYNMWQQTEEHKHVIMVI